MSIFSLTYTTSTIYHFAALKQPLFKSCERDFPGSPGVKACPSSTRGAGSITGWGTKTPHTWGPKTQNIKQKQYYKKFNKHFENGPHKKKKKSLNT